MKILAHRGFLDGVIPHKDNLFETLEQANRCGFGVEFDINLDPEGKHLVLAHDPAPWSHERDVQQHLLAVLSRLYHALNVKDIVTIPAILKLLADAKLQRSCFLFDFELLLPLPRARFLMQSIEQQGFDVAYRISDREPYAKEYSRNKDIRLIWLDSFKSPVLTDEIVTPLVESGKTIYYVSPDLHGCKDIGLMKSHWHSAAQLGIHGICTDYAQAARSYFSSL